MTADTPVRQNGRSVPFSIKSALKSLMSRVGLASRKERLRADVVGLPGPLLRDAGLSLRSGVGGSLDESWRGELRAQMEHCGSSALVDKD